MKEEGIISKQIEVYLHFCLNNGHIVDNYGYWLKSFAKEFKARNVYDITQASKVEFLTRVAVLHNSQHSLLQAERALNGFTRFYQARSRNLVNSRELGYTSSDMEEKMDRNKELVFKRVSDPKKWSWRALGSLYNIHYTTARQIFTVQSPKYLGKKLSTG